MSVLLYLFDYPAQAQDQRLMAAVDFDYRHDVEETFGPFRDHRAVQLLKEIAQRRNEPPNFTHNAPPQLMLYVSDPPDLAPQLALPEELINRAGGQEILDSLLSAMRDFARETNFMDFYHAHEDFYGQLIQQAAAEFHEQDLKTMEDYYGVSQSRYQIKLVPLFGQGSFGPKLTRADGITELYFILGTQGLTEQNQPLLANPKTFRHQLWHEFGHSFVNELMAEHQNEVAAYESLYQPVSKRMEKLGYGNWWVAVNEHIVRAVVIRLAKQVEGETAANALLEEERSKGFIYLDGLLQKLEEYEQNRGQYPTFARFYAELIKGFEDVP